MSQVYQSHEIAVPERSVFMSTTKVISEWYESLLQIFFPSLCLACSRKLFAHESYLCIHCMFDLPRTRFHTDDANKVAQIFWGRVPVVHATSWLFFRKGSRFQRLIHQLKYKGMHEIGFAMGQWMGYDLLGSGFCEVDLVVPVPLHPKKLKMRGYNQSERIAAGLSDVLKKPLVTGCLVRNRFTDTQTRKSRFSRWQNVEGIFGLVESQRVAGRHILLVDDVVTTGATLEAAATALLAGGAGKVSIATLATAEI